MVAHAQLAIQISIPVPSCTGTVVPCSRCVLGLPYLQRGRSSSTKRSHRTPSVDQRNRLASETSVEREARLQQMSAFQHAIDWRPKRERGSAAVLQGPTQAASSSAITAAIV